MKEPDVALDPNDPDRVLVCAVSREKRRASAFTWASLDGGASWISGRLEPVERGHDIASDPSIAYGPDCRVYFGHLDFGDARRARNLADGFWLPTGGLGVQRSADCGRTFSPSLVTRNPSARRQADKDWLAVDANPASPFRGSVYVFWSFIGSLVDKSDTATDVQFARSRDGGRTFSPPRQLSSGGYVVQAVVRPNGTLDAIWEERRWYSRKIWHVSSADGGETFSEPRLVVAVAETDTLDWPVLAALGDDALVAGWCERARDPGHRYESRISYSVFRNSAWSAAQPLEPGLPPGTWISIPALASTNSAAWLLAYRVDAHTTRVVLYRMTPDTLRFEAAETLAIRHFGVDQFCPGWLDCFPEEPKQTPAIPEQFSPGDYVGLRGAKRRVVAAYILPLDDDRRVSRLPTLYVTIVDE